MNVPPQGQVPMQQGGPQPPQQGPQQTQQQQQPQQPNPQQQQQQQAQQQAGQGQQSGQGPGSQQQQPGTPGSQAQQLQQQQQQQTQEKLDNISKVKALVGPLKDHLAVALKHAAHLLHFNTMVDNGSSKGMDLPPRLDVSLEAFYSTCDQIELHLKTAIECLTQGASSQRYLPLNVLPTKTEPIPGQDGLLYPQYLNTVRAQIQFAKQVHDILMLAVQNIAPPEQ
ncbi:hypothetical protein ONE63_007461 [Megalurothrips usitatus]|uniref:Mediator of RNA polymerase II transcription subunit 29 n=1 Tax=Megalurothrips usitatus TaxID=439358 RepID=A0AAV7XS07_9NEOP|nr:hypothetical protein ONE63_007461 [Megalurothrips usitatus]